MSVRKIGFALLLALLLGSAVGLRTNTSLASREAAPSFSPQTGQYTVDFDPKSGHLIIGRVGRKAALQLTELPGRRSRNLLASARSARVVGGAFVVRGSTPWTAFTFRVSLTRTPGLIHYTLTLNPRANAPSVRFALPDIRLVRGSGRLHEYAPAPPIAGNSVFLSIPALGSSALYFANYTTLGHYFDRTHSGVTRGSFIYPNAGGKKALVGVAAGNTVGYVPPPLSLQHLPHGKSTRVTDSYLYLIPAVPSDEASTADTYLKLLGGVYDAIQQPNIPAPNWNNLAKQEASDLADPSASTTVTTRSYLRSYVSDTRSAPELATQASVLAGLRAYDRHTGVFIPLEYQLESSLPSFYDPTLHTVTNVLGAGSDSNAQEESWSYVGDLISLLQVAELGSKNARNVLLDSANSAITLAHTNQYSFPQDFLYKTWNRQGTGTEPDVAGGYAWLMLGLYDLTSDGRYLDEAKASIVHFAGQGFNLSYETHMTAYGAAAAERLYKMTGDKTYRGYAALALANLFHAVRLWDCTYGSCRQGKGYHTFMGLNPLPWADYTAMFEQSQAWLALRDYLQYADGEPTYITDLVRGFVQYTPIVMQYALPPLLPAGAATANPLEYSFVPHNNLQWYVPLKDLRQGESTSGAMGQEIYGAGGPFIFASAQRLTTATPLPGVTLQATGAATPTGTPTP